MSGCQRHRVEPWPWQSARSLDLIPELGTLSWLAMSSFGVGHIGGVTNETGAELLPGVQAGTVMESRWGSGLQLVRNPLREWRMFAKSSSAVGTSPGAFTSHWSLFASRLV